ncbi:serine/threonine-protein kinase [Catenulispora yoronensis]
MSSPRVVPVIGADPDGDEPWLATEYVSSPDLAVVVGTDGVLKNKKLKKLTRGLAKALEAIHAAGLTHRDLKPGNILMTDDGPNVIDFGLAIAPGDTTLTQAGYAIGTLPYMSPEQIAGKAVRPPSDIYSLGAVVVFAATGLPPSAGGTTDTLKQPLRGVIEDCLEPDPDDRPTPDEIIERLQTPVDEDDEKTLQTTTTTPTEVDWWHSGGAKLLGWVLLGAAVLIGGGVSWGDSIADAHVGDCVNHSFGDEDGWNFDKWCRFPMPFAPNYTVLYTTVDTGGTFPLGGCAAVVPDWNPAKDVQVRGLKDEHGVAVSFCARPRK